MELNTNIPSRRQINDGDVESEELQAQVRE